MIRSHVTGAARLGRARHFDAKFMAAVAFCTITDTLVIIGLANVMTSRATIFNGAAALSDGQSIWTSFRRRAGMVFLCFFDLLLCKITDAGDSGPGRNSMPAPRKFPILIDVASRASA